MEQQSSLEDNLRKPVKRASSKKVLKREQQQSQLTPSKISAVLSDQSSAQVQQAPTTLPVPSELIEYVNRLENLLVNTSTKLRKQREVHAKILKSVTQFVGFKGITKTQLDSFISSHVTESKDLLSDNEIPSLDSQNVVDWMGYLHEQRDSHARSKPTNSIPVSMKPSFQAGGTTSTPEQQQVSTNGNIQPVTNQGNIIRITMNQSSVDKTKLSAGSTSSSVKSSKKGNGENNQMNNSQPSLDEPKTKKKRKVNGTTYPDSQPTTSMTPSSIPTSQSPNHMNNYIYGVMPFMNQMQQSSLGEYQYNGHYSIQPQQMQQMQQQLQPQQHYQHIISQQNHLTHQ